MGTYLNRTPASAGSRTTWTWSAWVKRSGDLTQTNTLFEAYVDGSNFTYMRFAPDYIRILNFISGSTNAVYNTSSLYRDVSAWYHIVWTWDTTNGTASDRSRLYVNGTRITNFSTETNPTSGEQSNINNNTAHYIGSTGQPSLYMDGYMANVYFIDGQALTPASFGETDSTTGIWKPKTYSGTYGTNGFLLAFKNSGALGTDTSGNSNTFTVNNAGTNAQVTDTPSNVFCTMSSIDKGSDAGSLSLGNLKITNGTSGSASNQKVRGTLAVTKGKWYFEMKQEANTTSIGLLATEEEQSTTTANGMFVEYLVNGEMRYWNGSSRVTKTTGIDTYTANDIVGCALDMDNRRAYFSKNGVWQETQRQTQQAAQVVQDKWLQFYQVIQCLLVFMMIPLLQQVKVL